MLTERQKQRKEWLVAAISAIEQAQLGVLSSGKLSLSFNGRAVTNMAPSDLENLREKFVRELDALERQEIGVKRTRTVRVIG